MMPQKKTWRENKELHSIQNMGYDVTITSFDRIEFGQSFFMIIEQPLFCILPEILDHE